MGKLSNWDALTGAIGTTQAELYQGLANLDIPFVDAAIKLTCNINSEHADTLAKTAYERAFINTLCNLTGGATPQELPPPFAGGQCSGVRYRVTITTDRFFINSGDLIQENVVRDDFVTYGEVSAVYGELGVNDDRPELSAYYFFINGFTADGDIDNRRYFIAGNNIREEIKDISLAREDGLPDNCGDPASSFPPGATRPDIFSQPVVDDSSLPPGSTVDIDKTGDLPGDTNLDFPICVNFGEFSICLDHDGIYKNNNNEPDSSGETGSDETPEEFNEEDFDEVTSECIPEPGLDPPTGTDPAEDVDSCNVDNGGFDYLLITMTVEPDSSKVIQHHNPDHDDFFVGFLHWKILNDGDYYYFPAIPIKKRRNVFKPPEGITGYSAFTIYGAKISIKELRRKIEDA